MTPLEFCRDLWQQQTRVPGLSYDVVCVILVSAILVKLPTCDRQTGRRTDRQTDRHMRTAYTALA